MREIKYPLAQIVGRNAGRNSPAYLMALAVEQWAVKNGYRGYKRKMKRTRKDRMAQQSIKF